MRRTIVIGLIILLAFPFVALAQQEPVATVNTGQLNVRSGPGLNFGAITTLPHGFGVRMIARNDEGNWILIQLTNGVQGWVNVNYIYTLFPTRNLPVDESAQGSPITPTATVTGAVNLNVRTNADPNSQIIAVIGRGTPLELLGRNFDATWAFVRLPDGRTGWVGAGFITASVPVRSVTPADGSVVGPVPPARAHVPSVRHYTVVRGDTLASIARRFGVSLSAIVNANPQIVNINRIFAGQRIIVPLIGY
jgi:uncharacterized protein YgiM (DUF1202 family)